MADTKNQGGSQSGSTMQGSSGSQDWSTKDPQRFLNQLRDVIGHAKDAGVSQQQLRDTIDQSYSGSGGGSSSGGSTTR